MCLRGSLTTPIYLFYLKDTIAKTLRVNSKYIDYTSCRKFVTGNGFSDPDFLQEANILPVNQRLRVIWVN